MDDIEAYVRQTAALQGLQLDDAALLRITEVFRRNAALADQVVSFALDDACEAAPIFRAAP